MLVLRSIMPAISLKNSRKKTTLQVFFILSTWLVSPLGIHGTLLLPFILLMTTVKKKTLFADYSHLFKWNCGLY